MTDTSHALVVMSDTLPASIAESLPDIVRQAGPAAIFAADEFFYGTIRNEHTHRAYRHAINRFLAWAEGRGFEAGADCAARRGAIF